MNLIRGVIQTVASPSGRASSRRVAFLWAVFSALLVAVWQGLAGGDVKSGVLSLFSAVLAATGTAVTVGRFAERGSESRDTEAKP